MPLALAPALPMLVAASTTIPLSFNGNRWLYLCTVLSLSLTVLMALEWLWRIVWSAIEKPARLLSEVTVIRLLHGLLLSTVVVGAGPDLWLLSRWRDMSPGERSVVTLIDHWFDLGTALPFGLAWLLSLTAAHSFAPSIAARALTVETWPFRDDWRRVGTIFTGCLAIASALTFGH